ncbi:hypothetical protein PR202_gb27979 [Eleusine coracana subsp. coracana]|uniref:Uncharacterized protein n=1 Tax=Eleusine coracana subsp. coracana TaxID=191504 RepID=A0AAV5FVL5_ELECO|nr:hypothetical protein QOZ80_6AG0545860 [Eleusine coracana subsp. coracana]GJN38898.1 hypothetical protein PR202_gb27979 [Eleusine coracana subsp. coracana]
MAAKLRGRAPGAVALLLATFLVLAATVASARPLKLSSSSSEGDGVRHTTVESPAGDIQTVVRSDGGAGDRSGHKFMSIDMLGGIKDSGPSPGAGH